MGNISSGDCVEMCSRVGDGVDEAAEQRCTAVSDSVRWFILDNMQNHWYGPSVE